MPLAVKRMIWNLCRRSGRQCAVGFCPVRTAYRRHEPPFGGIQGAEPLALLSPHFFGKKWGRRRRPKLRSLPGRPESSFPPLGLLSPRRPLRWVAAGAPLGASPESARRMAGDHRSPLRTARRVVAPHGASGGGGKRADDIRPYGPGSCHTAPRAARQGCRALRLSPRPLEGEVSLQNQRRRHRVRPIRLAGWGPRFFPARAE